MLTKYLKKTNLPSEQKENKDFLIKKLGFYDIEAEYASNMIEEKVIKVAPFYQPIHEDVIREVDEGPPDSSLNDIKENKETLAIEHELLNKPFGTLATYKRPSTNVRAETKKIMEGHLVLPAALNGEKRVAFSGMLGLNKIPQSEIKAIFNSSTIVPDLDDFTETFFNRVPFASSFAAQDQEKDKTKKEILSPRDQTNLYSSFLELEESNVQPCSKENSPANNENNFMQNCDQEVSPLDNLFDTPAKSVSEKMDQGEVLITEAERKKQELYAKRVTTIKEENTNASNTSPATTLCESNAKFHKKKTLKQKPTEEEGSKKNPIIEPSDKLLDKEPKDYLSPISPEKKEPKLVKKLEIPTETPEAIFEEKFILKMGEISIESTLDVRPKKAVALDLPEIKINTVHLKPPFKVKLIIIPTEWPVESRIDENETQKSDYESNNESTKKESTLREGVGENSSVSGMSKSSKLSSRSRSKRKTTKRKPKAKKRKGKKGLDDSSSKFSNSSKKRSNKSINNPTPSVNDSRFGGSKHSLTDAASAMGSVSPDTNTKKGKKQEVEEDKKQIEKQAVSTEIQNNQNGDALGKKLEIPWSGQEVLPDSDPYAAVWITNNMTNIRIWPHGNKGLLANIRWIVRRFINSEICENFMNLLVITNTITLAMDRYQQPVSEANIMDELNYVFTSIFTAELSLKLFGMGLVRYLSDSLNYLDCMVVLFSWVEIIFLGGSGAISAFRSLRVFRLVRTVRVLRVARLLRGLQSMMTLMDVISNTIGSFGYIGLMLLIIMLIYALFGTAMFAGKWYYPDGLPRPNFQSFNNAFISVFQLLTVENWPTLLYAGLRNTFQPLVAFYYISFILIGNYILLNMFLAIMLDSFVEVSAGQDDDEEEVF